MASFTDQKQRVATQKDIDAKWKGSKGNFRCYLCGYRFKVGDLWRWVYDNDSGGHGNFIVCADCDGDDVRDRWAKANAELEARFWWAMLR